MGTACGIGTYSHIMPADGGTLFSAVGQVNHSSLPRVLMRIERLNNDAGYVGLSLRLQPSDIDVLIERLRELRSDPTRHFHLSTVPRREDDVYIDVELSSQADDETSNAAQSGVAIPRDDRTDR